MSVALLDVNVLIALFDPSHPQHEPAHQMVRPESETGMGYMLHYDQPKNGS